MGADEDVGLSGGGLLMDSLLLRRRQAADEKAN
jgi:hypothetical protein